MTSREAAVGERREITAYEIVLPPGWQQFPVGRGTAERLLAHISRVLEQSGNSELLAQVRASTYRAVKSLRDSGGIDIFIPQGNDRDAPIPASLTSMRVALGPAGVDGALAHLTHGREVESVDVPVGTAYRWSAPSHGKDELSGLDAENVFYLFPMPEPQQGSGILFTYNVLQHEGIADEYREILVLIFDAMMQSLIWVHDDNA
ncbi:hypothetical protein SAMN04489806_0857 [Paramicrobacterium humi]|uniref:Uncharacterized protein n=1 Tax=Paramicrobacterium humi TaxID=640635 RepID=A0A1H4JVD6_9MICO|nr:hypothetical protein [Microbacterium humi]SEB49622.1 hypothetical protein SAMN04489806_0857 [Microbacterium humi]